VSCPGTYESSPGSQRRMSRRSLLCRRRSAVDDAIDDPLPGCSDGRRDDEDDDDDDDLSSLRFVDTECIEWTSHQRASRLLPTPPSTVMDEEDWDDLDDGWLPTDGDTLHTGADEAVRERRVGQTRSPLVLPVLTSPEAWHLPGRDALKGSSASSSTPDVRPSFCQLLRYKPLDLPSRSSRGLVIAKNAKSYLVATAVAANDTGRIVAICCACVCDVGKQEPAGAGHGRVHR